MNSLRKTDGRLQASVIAFAAMDRRSTMQRRLAEIASLRRQGRRHLWLVPNPADRVRYAESYDGPDAA
jgi:hypothetical protein